MAKARILIAEDEPALRDVLRMQLELEDYEVVEAHDGRQALEKASEATPDIVLLDVMMPFMDGYAVCRHLRAQFATRHIPIVMLTARTDEGDKVLGFEVGADDYLTKPFGTRELVARVRALLRRAGVAGDSILKRGDLDIDGGRRVVERGGRRIELTTLEFDLLIFLAAHPGHVYSREALMDHVWGDDRMVDTRSIDSLVSRLRRKLTKESGDADCIQTVWGAGYRFAETL